jgi:hypothetical protein
MKHMQKVQPYLFQDYLVLALDSKWIEQFNCIPTFVVYINNNKLHLETNEVAELDIKSRKANNS